MGCRREDLAHKGSHFVGVVEEFGELEQDLSLCDELDFSMMVASSCAVEGWSDVGTCHSA